MKLLWRDPETLAADEFDLLCAGAAPGDWQPLDVARELLSGRWLPFALPDGMLAVEVVGERLCIRSLSVSNYIGKARWLAGVMQRLAADLHCNTIETTTFDQRMTAAMVRLGARPESCTLVLKVKGTADGQ